MKKYKIEAFYTSCGAQRAQNIPSKTIRFEVTGKDTLPAGTFVEAAGQDGVFKRVNCLSGFLSNVAKIRVIIGDGEFTWVRLEWESMDGDFDAELCGEMTSFNMELEHTNGMMRECVNELRVAA